MEITSQQWISARHLIVNILDLHWESVYFFNRCPTMLAWGVRSAAQWKWGFSDKYLNFENNLNLPFPLPIPSCHFFFCVVKASTYLQLLSSEPCVSCHFIHTSCWLGQIASSRSLAGCRKSKWEFCTIRHLGQQIRGVWQGRPHNTSSGRL